MRSTRLARAAIDASSTSAANASTAGHLPRKARIAIVGAGPSGFYAASRLLSRIPFSPSERTQPLGIDMFDRLPVPHGLVRYGVAPDHPDVKNVEHKFEAVSQDPRLRFAGNVNVVHSLGSGEGANPYPEAVQVPLEVLSRYYTHILFSYGASTGRSLGIPGSAPGELAGVYTALEFVNWYNGHPASHDAALLTRSHFHVDLANKHHLSVIGAGNVALDVARIVLRSSTPFLDSGSATSVTSNKAPGLAALEETDVPEPVLAELARCKVKDVDIFARRGPAQLAFTNKEVREMLSLQGIALRPPESHLLESALVQLEELAASAASKASSDADRANEIASEVRVKKRLLGLLSKGSKTRADASHAKTWGLHFFRSPAKFSSKPESKHVASVEWNVTTLQSGRPTPRNLDAADPKKATWGSGSTDAGSSPASTSTATGETVTTATDMIVSSVGYQSEPLFSASCSATDPHQQPSSSSSSSSSDAVVQDGRLVQLPFDASRCIVPNLGGRIIDPATRAPIARAYVSGWLARGPQGVIATTMIDAYSVADVILADLHAAPSTPSASSQVDRGDLLDKLQQGSSNRVVGFDDWRKIDHEERRRGARLGKIREKLLTVRDMLDVIK